MKNKNYMIISINAKKDFDTIQHPLMIKIVIKTGIEGTHLNTIKAIYDISGGDVANSILPYLDFEVIKKSDKEFWGYSDLTTVINAIYKKTGKASVLYQVRHLIYEYKEQQIENFKNKGFEIINQYDDGYNVKYVLKKNKEKDNKTNVNNKT